MFTPDTVIHAWFTPPLAEYWFSSTPEIDAYIRTEFEALWQQAKTGGLESWQSTPEGCLALCIVLDQFPLNMYRGQALSFSTEQQAVKITKQAIAQGFDQQLPVNQRLFLYMPLMHSENVSDQALSVQSFEQSGMDSAYPHHHQSIVQRFGRFPHRNAILGRQSTPAELQYLNSSEAFKG
ncbi:MAG: hypothetical protein RLZZ422_364 [Pseudomonadota bacterium]|jgi:uncharacterized protein (DUF924 family)